MPTVGINGSRFASYVAEGNSGLKVAPVAVELSRPSDQQVTVTYSITQEDGSNPATAGQDFLAQTGSLVFAPGQTQASIPVTIYGDTLYEGDEYVRIDLTGATNAMLVTSGAEPDRSKYWYVTIQNDDVASANRAPVAGMPLVGTPNASTGVVAGSVSATDADGDPLTYSGSTTTSKGSLAVSANGGFTYTPTAAARHAAAKDGASTAQTADTLTIIVSDGKGGSTTVPVTVAISPSNVGPVGGSSSVGYRNPSTGAVSGTVSATDSNGDALTYSGSTTTSKGTVVVNADGTFTFTPTVTARDAAANSQFTAVATIPGWGGGSAGIGGWIVNTLVASPDGQHLYAIDPNALATSVFIANTSDNTPSAPIQGFKYPQGLALSADGSRLYVSDAITVTNPAGRVSVIDTATNRVISTIEGLRSPKGLAVSPDGKILYVADSGSTSPDGHVKLIDTNSNKVIATIADPGGAGNPSFVSLSPDGSRLYVGHSAWADISVLDTKTNSYVTSIWAASYTLTGVTFSPDGSRAYARGSGFLDVIDTTKNQVISSNRNLAGGAGNLVLSPDGTRAYTVDGYNSDYATGTLVIIDTATNQIINTQPGFDWPTAVVVSPDGKSLYVRQSSGVTVLQNQAAYETFTVIASDGYGGTTTIPVTVHLVG